MASARRPRPSALILPHRGEQDDRDARPAPPRGRPGPAGPQTRERPADHVQRPPCRGGDAAPLWVDGELWLEVYEPGDGPARLVHVPRPYGLIGRLEGADVRIDDRAVSARHVYLHLDRRGLYAVDLASRTGTRLPLAGRLACWLAPGDEIELAGRRVRVADLRLRGPSNDPDPARPDLLAYSDDPALPRVTFVPVPARDASRSLDSELVFAGRGSSCGVRVEGASASRVHATLVRARGGASSSTCWAGGPGSTASPSKAAAPLNPGDVLGIGLARFDVRIEASAGAGPPPAAAVAPARPAFDSDSGSDLEVPVLSLPPAHRPGTGCSPRGRPPWTRPPRTSPTCWPPTTRRPRPWPP